MLPQTIPSGAEIKVVINSSEELETVLTGTWVTGKNYVYSINIEYNGITIDPTTEISDWEEEIKNLAIGSVGSGNTWTQPSVNDGEDMGVEDWEAGT